MRTKLLLVAAVLMVAATPELFPVRAISQSVPETRLAATVPETFAPVCNSDPLPESRPAPAWLRRSFIGDACQAPAQPKPVDGYTASLEEINAGMAAAERYAAAADYFQACVVKFIVARKESGRKLSRSEEAIQNYRIVLSQQAKEIVKRRTRAAIVAFNEYGSTCPMPM